MFNWKVEEMALRNEKGNTYIGGKTKVYRAESETSREDKIAFIDSMNDGKMSYLLGLKEKFDADKESLPKDSWGDVKTVSLKAWINKNDKKYTYPIIDNHYHYGSVQILGCERRIGSDFNVKRAYDTYSDFVDECFHRQLIRCEDMEDKYFKEHDEGCILDASIRDYARKYYTTFGAHIVISSSDGCLLRDEKSNSERKLTVEEQRELISKYEQIDALVAKLSAETNIKF